MVQWTRTYTSFIGLPGGYLPLAKQANVPLVAFGSGVPTALIEDGYVYFDTSTLPYTQYVQRASAWHPAPIGDGT